MAYSVSNLLKNCKYNSFDKSPPDTWFIGVNSIFAMNKMGRGETGIETYNCIK
jgi:hypothetical protein